MSYKTSVIRTAHFNSAHRLHNKNWSDEQNRAVFGKCNNPNYHGHNYEFEVKVTGEVDPETGFVMDTKILKDLMEEYVIEKYDHKNLNLDTEDFKNVIPTAENIAKIIYQNLRSHIELRYDLKIKLYETSRNIVEYPGE